MVNKYMESRLASLLAREMQNYCKINGVSNLIPWSVGENVEQWELSCTAGHILENNSTSPSKAECTMPWNPVIPLLRLCLEELTALQETGAGAFSSAVLWQQKLEAP